ncbi:unnamed protein product [Schistocephalus solidus]|uniref:Peptidase S1 domain-containing protein n=1 Tax=Schistocephalus solidus TaxID=70667 RepID=A0A183SKQ0_SCHSO|nr:unnamed protein product [Schistocephalus solidus]
MLPLQLLLILLLSIAARSGHGLLLEYPMTILKAPYMASVGKCDAVIVSRSLVLASASCICKEKRPTKVIVGTSWNNLDHYPKNGHQVVDVISEKNNGYCAQGIRSDFLLIRISPPITYSHTTRAIGLHCSSSVPEQLAALGFHLPGRNYGFISEAVVNVKRGEHRYLIALNNDIPSNSVGPLVSREAQPRLFGMYSHRYGTRSYFKSLDSTSCNWINRYIKAAEEARRIK